MKSTLFISTLVASAFTLASCGGKGKSGYSYSTRGLSSSRKSSDCSSSSSSSSDSSCSSSSSSSSSSESESCGPQFKVIRKYTRWSEYAKVCHKHHMVPAKINSRNIYSAVRAIRNSKHRSAWIKSWNTDAYKGNLVLTAPNQRCDGPGSITVACRGVKKVALCMRKKDDNGDCNDKKDKKKHIHKKKRHHKKHPKKHHKKHYRKSSSSSSSSSSSTTDCSSSSSDSSSTSSSSSSTCPALPYIRRPSSAKDKATKDSSSKSKNTV